VAGVLCKTWAFGDDPHRKLNVVQRFGKIAVVIFRENVCLKMLDNFHY
jgi:hypothetical protein